MCGNTVFLGVCVILLQRPGEIEPDKQMKETVLEKEIIIELNEEERELARAACRAEEKEQMEQK